MKGPRAEWWASLPPAPLHPPVCSESMLVEETVQRRTEEGLGVVVTDKYMYRNGGR